ncbi:MAG: hypothetical protein WC028_24815 [Candidatus Obscuribacterales bacterium]
MSCATSLCAVAHCSTIASAARPYTVDGKPSLEQISTTKQAQSEKTETTNWQILSDNIERFGHLVPPQAEIIFGSSQITKFDKPGETPNFRQVIKLDMNTELELTATRLHIDEIAVMETSADNQYIHRNYNFDDAEPDSISDVEYTYAPRPDEPFFWRTLKGNLRNLIGMNKQELRNLFGVERCSSQPRQTIDYRIGNQRLRFYLKNNKVSMFKLVTDKYGQNSLFGTTVIQASVNNQLWPMFEENLDKIPTMEKVEYESLLKRYSTTGESNSSDRSKIPDLSKKRRYAIYTWLLDGRIGATVMNFRGFEQSILFEPFDITEDRELAHGMSRTGPGSGYLHPSEKDTVYTGAKRSNEATYWAAIKPNLRKLIGMKRQEIIALLGPERCSSEVGQTLDYRVGNSRLRFFMRNGVVIAFKLDCEQYLHDT